MGLLSSGEPMSIPGTDDQRIRRAMEMRVWYYAQNPGKIDERIRELDEEWDLERALGRNAAAMALTGTVLGIFSRKYLLLPAVAAGFLMQHAIQGWCPPAVLMRRLGLRTQAEIDAERHALLVLRGDFQGAGEQSMDRVDQALHALQTMRPQAGGEPPAYH